MSDKGERLLGKYGLLSIKDKVSSIALRKIADSVVELEEGDADFMLVADTGDIYRQLIQHRDYEKILIQQNFVIMRQLDRIASLLGDK